MNFNREETKEDAVKEPGQGGGVCVSVAVLALGILGAVRGFQKVLEVTNGSGIAQKQESSQVFWQNAEKRNIYIATLRERSMPIVGGGQTNTCVLPDGSTLCGFFLDRREGGSDFFLIVHEPGGGVRFFVRLAHDAAGEILNTLSNARAEMVRQGALTRRKNNAPIVSFTHYHTVFLGEGGDTPPCLIIDTSRNKSWTGDWDQVVRMSPDEATAHLQMLLANNPSPMMTKNEMSR